MAWDIAIDRATGDWLFGANTDLQPAVGEQVVQQRIMARLKISRGWILDPTRGKLGSLIRARGLRLPRGRLMREIPLMVREALAPMHDVELQDIRVEEHPTDMGAVMVFIDYLTIDPTSSVPLDQQTQQSLAFAVSI